MQFFFYGTLMDPAVRAIVLRRADDDVSVEPATLRGYRRWTMAGKTYPVVVPEKGASVDGVLMRGITPPEAWRLTRFEADAYDCVERRVKTDAGQHIRAWVYVAGPSAEWAAEAWDFVDWRRRYREAFLVRTRKRAG